MSSEGQDVSVSWLQCVCARVCERDSKRPVPFAFGRHVRAHPAVSWRTRCVHGREGSKAASPASSQRHRHAAVQRGCRAGSSVHTGVPVSVALADRPCLFLVCLYLGRLARLLFKFGLFLDFVSWWISGKGRGDCI